MAKKNNKNYKNKKKNGNGSKPFQVSARQRVNWPLMPETRLAKVKYTTRIRIDPPKVNAGTGETANDMAIHTFVLNSMYSPDYTTGSTTFHSKSGAPKHQPRMYDQWSAFYEYATVVGAKVNMAFCNKQHVQNYTTTHTGSSNVVTAMPVTLLPLPCVIGYLKNEYDTTVSPSVKLDDVLEKNQIVYKKTKNQSGMYYLTKKWSLKQDPLYKTELIQRPSGGSDVSWGASFGSDVDTNNRRYLHIVVNPLTTHDDDDPLPFDVLVELEQIVLLSNLRDIAQSH